MKKIIQVICMLLIACMLSSCAAEEVVQVKEYPVIKIMTMGTEPECGMQVIYDMLDPLTEEELGVDVRISFYQWGDEAELMKKLVNSDSFDIYVFGSAFGSGELSKKNAFVDMKEYLHMVPELTKFYKENGVDLSSQEHVYSFPRLNDDSSYGLLYREDLRKEWGLGEIKDFESVEAYLYKAKEEYPSVAPINDRRYFESLLAMTVADKYRILGKGLVIPWGEPHRVQCIMDTPEYMELLKIARKWYCDGIVSEDILYLQNNNTSSTLEMMKQDKAVLEFCNHFSAVCNNYAEQLYEANASWELGWLNYDSMNAICYSNIAVGQDTIGLAISNNSLYKEQSLRLLEKMHVDSRYYNLFSYGVEGTNYNLSESGEINYNGIEFQNIIRGQIGLECDCMALPLEYSGTWNEVYRNTKAEIKAIAEKNGESWSREFLFSTVEYGEWQQAMNEYTNSTIRWILETGVSEQIETDLKEFRSQLTNVGYDELIAAVQRDLDIYWKQKNKER